MKVQSNSAMTAWHRRLLTALLKLNDFASPGKVKSENRHLSLNVIETKEVIVKKLQKKGVTHLSVIINNAVVEKVDTFKYLTQRLDMSYAFQLLFFKKPLWSQMFKNLLPKNSNPYCFLTRKRCRETSDYTSKDLKVLKRVVCIAERIFGTKLPNLPERTIHTARKALKF